MSATAKKSSAVIRRKAGAAEKQEAELAEGEILEQTFVDGMDQEVTGLVAAPAEEQVGVGPGVTGTVPGSEGGARPGGPIRRGNNIIGRMDLTVAPKTQTSATVERQLRSSARHGCHSRGQQPQPPF